MAENLQLIPHQRGIGGGCTGDVNGGGDKALRGSATTESADHFKVDGE